jgi:hypothetical protein
MTDQPTTGPAHTADHPDPDTGAPGPDLSAPGSPADRITPVSPTRAARTDKQPVPVAAWVRRVAGVLLAGVALLIWFDMAPEDNSYESARTAIEASDDANNILAEGAPQQEVVNGWTTIEYLSLLSEQQEQSNSRLDALILLALIGGSVALATSRTNART